jgi:competence protein ComEC
MSAPFVFIFASFAAGILTEVYLNVPGFCLIAAIVIAAASLRSKSFAIAFTAQLLFLFCTGAMICKKADEKYNNVELRSWVARNENETVAVKVRLKQTPEINSDFVVLRVDVLSIFDKKMTGVARLTVPGRIEHLPVAGDILEAFVRFKAPTSFRAEGCFNYERYLQKEGVHVLGSVKNSKLIRIVENGQGLKHWMSGVRLQMIRRVIHGFSPTDAGILRALWLDDRSGINREIEQSLIDAGVFHVVAISGFHVTVLLLICFWALKRAVRFPIAMAILSVLLLFYLFLLEGRSSIVRSVLTFLVLTFAVLRQERPAMANVLALCAFLQIAWNPLELFDPGFHLTYLSTAAILFVALPLCNVIPWPRKIYRYAWSFIVVSVAIQFVLAPYQALVFHRVAFGALIANLTAIPLSSFLIAAGTGALPSAFLHSLLNPLIRFPVRWFAESSEFFSGLWLTSFPEPPLFLVFGFYAAILASLLFRKKRAAYLSAAVLSIACFVFILARKPETTGKLILHFIDVGQGDSILIQYPDGTADLIDGGGFWNTEALDTGEAVLLPYLSHHGITRLHRIFLTHAHADHMNGLISLRRYIPSDLFYCTRMPISDQGFQKLLTSNPIRIQGIKRDMEFKQGTVSIRVLAPEDRRYTKRVANDDSLVLLLNYGTHKILLAGDAEKFTEQRLRELEPSMNMSLLKVAHHGSKTSTSIEFLNHFRPSLAVISAGRNNWFGHPNPKVLWNLRKQHASILRTDLEGTIRVYFEREEMRIDTYID